VFIAACIVTVAFCQLLINENDDDDDDEPIKPWRACLAGAYHSCRNG